MQSLNTYTPFKYRDKQNIAVGDLCIYLALDKHYLVVGYHGQVLHLLAQHKDSPRAGEVIHYKYPDKLKKI